MRVRENSEQIALLQGESAERTRLSERFGRVVENWYAIMSRTKRLTAFTASYAQAAVIFPFILVAPAYFAEKIQLGGMMQTASAFGSVQSALSFFVSVYRTLAEWRAVVARLDGFEMSIASATRLATAADRSMSCRRAAATKSICSELLVRLPNGTPLVAADGFSFRSHERTLVTGPSGAGKSTLFRAIAGIWPFGTGSIAIPANAIADDAAAAAVFSDRLAAGGDRLSGGSQRLQFGPGQGCAARGRVCRSSPRGSRRKRTGTGCCRSASSSVLGLARALLHAPQYLFLDEATASLDEASEAALYRLLEQKLPATTIVSIGHRSHARGLPPAQRRAGPRRRSICAAGPERIRAVITAPRDRHARRTVASCHRPSIDRDPRHSQTKGAADRSAAPSVSGE